MKCPFTGKPCLLPKEVFVTEVRPEGARHLHLCRLCGDKYIDDLNEADVVTKSFEIVSSKDGISHSEQVLDEETPLIDDASSLDQKPVPNAVLLMRQVLQLEHKLQEAVDREDYESAAKLRDILNAVHKNIEDQQDEEEEEEEDPS